MPTDEQLARWAARYGTTGVKRKELEFGANAGIVVWYRELSLHERMLALRLERLEQEHPGAVDVPRMIVSLVLLEPTLEQLPMPAMAAAELYPLVLTRGHGFLPEEDADAHAVPPHILQDVAQARASVGDLAMQSLVMGLVLRMATRADGSIDTLALWELCRLPAGLIRDLAVLYEATARLLRQAAEQSAGGKLPREVVERLTQLYQSPLEVIDRATPPAPEERRVAEEVLRAFEDLP